MTFTQVLEDLFDGEEDAKDLLSMVAKFHPGINEVFFAKEVVLMEEESSIAAFSTAAEITGLFDRHPDCRYDVSLVDCCGKTAVKLYQQVLNHFGIPYRVVHDEDTGKAQKQENAEIADLLNGNPCKMLCPDLEGVLGYSPSKQKPYRAMCRVKELGPDGLPDVFMNTMNWIYFSQEEEPPVQASV